MAGPHIATAQLKRKHEDECEKSNEILLDGIHTDEINMKAFTWKVMPIFFGSIPYHIWPHAIAIGIAIESAFDMKE